MSAASHQCCAAAESVTMDYSEVFNIPYLSARKTRPADELFGALLLLENLDNLVTDVGSINYTENGALLSGKNSSVLTPITEPFCDNIMVVKICDKLDCQDQLDSGRSVTLKKEVCDAFNNYLVDKFSMFVSESHRVKAKPPFLIRGTTSETAKGIEASENILSKYKNPVAVPYKVELADAELSELMDELPGILQQLRLDDFYLMDLDITQDFAGIFNKTEMCHYLVSKHDFCMQGDYPGNTNIIVRNDSTVGIDCLTWLNSNCRIKVYNKFICQLTSPGVSSDIGNHIIDFIKCPDTRLRETFASPLAKEHGITRLEATIYNYRQDGVFDPVDDCLNVLRIHKQYLKWAPMYSVPISSMWCKLCASLRNSCCVVFNSVLQFAYWGNKNTRKLTGVQINLPDDHEREKIINYVLSAYSFNNLPVNYVEIVNAESGKDEVNIVHECYIKAGETYFSQSRTLFWTIPSNINIAELGLVPTNNVVPQVLRKRTNVSNLRQPFPIKEITPLRPVNVSFLRKRKLELEENEIKIQKLEYLAETTRAIEEYKLQLEEEEPIADVRERFTNLFKLRRWRNLDTSGEYKILAFTVNIKGKWPFVGVLAEKAGNVDTSKIVYHIKGYTKPLFIKLHSRLDVLKKYGYIVSNCGGLDVVHLATENPFAEFKTDGITTFNGNSFANIVNLKFYTEIISECGADEQATYTQEDVECINNCTMQEI